MKKKYCVILAVVITSAIYISEILKSKYKFLFIGLSVNRMMEFKNTHYHPIVDRWDNYGNIIP